MSKEEFKWKLRYGDLVNAAKEIDELDEQLRKHDNITYDEWEPDGYEDRTAAEYGFDGSYYEVNVSRPKEIGDRELWQSLLVIGNGLRVEVMEYDESDFVFVRILASKQQYRNLSDYVYEAQWLLWAADNPDEFRSMIVEQLGQ